MTTTDLFGPYPASAGEREGRVLAVFGDQGPLRRVQMRAGRHRCPGCHESIGNQCVRPRPGGKKAPRKLCHPSRVAVVHPCATHHVSAGVPCPASRDYPMPGICPDREQLAADDLRVLAAGITAEMNRRIEQEQEDAARQRATTEAQRLTSLDQRG
jgi:hypothetical protein